MVEKLKHMSVAEMEDLLDMEIAVLAIRSKKRPQTYTWEDIVADIRFDFDSDRVPDMGAGRALRNYENTMAEIISEHDAVKEKYRRQRKDARKHKELPKDRKEQKKMRNFRVYGKHNHADIFVDPVHYEDIKYCGGGIKSRDWQIPVRTRMIAESESIARADWQIDFEELEYEISYAEMDRDSMQEDLDEFNTELDKINSELESLNERKSVLEKAKKVIEPYMESNTEFLQKYKWAKEMM